MVRYVVQVIDEVESTQFKVDYYNVISLTGNRKFKKNNESFNNIVELSQIEKKLEPPRILREGSIVFPLGLFDDCKTSCYCRM